MVCRAGHPFPEDGGLTKLLIRCSWQTAIINQLFSLTPLMAKASALHQQLLEIMHTFKIRPASSPVGRSPVACPRLPLTTREHTHL